jgi:hypothetical protein
MNAIKRAVAPLQRSRTSVTDAGPSSATEHSLLTEFVLNRLQGPSKELFAISFAAQMSVDKNALVYNLADALPWLGIELLGNAVRLMTKHYKEGEYRVEEVFLPKDKNPKGGRPGKRYLISLDMFEDLLMLADTKQDKEARKMYKQLRDAVQDYMKMEMEATAKRAQQELEARTTQLAIRDEEHAARLAVDEQEKVALATQLKNLREARSYLYAFHLFDDRYKCGVTNNPDKREKQHRTSCPSGRMVHTVVIACKQSEKLLDSIMKRHGNHVRQEEYEIEGGEQRVRQILNTIARVEEILHSVPFERYPELLAFANGILQVEERDGETVTGRPIVDGSSVRKSRAARVKKKSSLNRVEQWLVNRLETRSLPPAILSKQLAEELGRFDSNAPPVTSNWVTPKMRVYEGQGVEFSDNQVTIKSGEFKGRGRGYYLDADTLLKTFMETGIMEPPILDDDSV